MSTTDTVDLTKPTKKPAPKKAAAPAKPKSTPFKSVDDIRLGMMVRDPATNLTGIAMFKAELISGTVQYAIQSPGDGESVKDAFYVDDFMLEHVGEGVSARCPAPDPAATFPLGAELEDEITGFKGIATDRTTYLNGCIHYTLQPQQKKNTLLGKMIGEPVRSTHFDYKRLKQVGDGVAGPPPKVKKAEPAPEKKFEHKRSETGGPMRLAPSRRA